MQLRRIIQTDATNSGLEQGCFKIHHTQKRFISVGVFFFAPPTGFDGEIITHAEAVLRRNQGHGSHLRSLYWGCYTIVGATVPEQVSNLIQSEIMAVVENLLIISFASDYHDCVPLWACDLVHTSV